MADDTPTPPSPMQLPGTAFQPMQNVLPPTSPVQPQGVDPNEALSQSMLQASQLGQQTYGEAIQRQRALADAVSQLQQQQSALPIPKMGYQPQFQSPSGKGVLGGIGAVLGDIGKGALLGLGATGPGEAVQGAIYGPGVRQYREKSGQLAQQIQELQNQQQREEGVLTSAGQLQYKPYMAQAQNTRAGAAMMNAQTKAAYEPERLRLEQRNQDLKKQVADGRITVDMARQQMERDINDSHNRTLITVMGMSTDQRDRDAQIQAYETEHKLNTDHWLLGLTDLLPTPPSQRTTTPPGPTAPGSKPKAPAPAKPAAQAKGGAQEVTATGPNGHKIAYRGGRWVDAASGKPIQ